MKRSTGRVWSPPARPLEDADDVLAGFDAHLAERTGVSMARERELANMQPAELLGEAESLHSMLDRFAAVVVAAHDGSGAARGFVQRLDLKLISRDHDWRRIFKSLVATHDGGEQYLQVALARYRQYLESRASLVHRLLAKRGHLTRTAELGAPSAAKPRLDRLPPRSRVPVSLVYRGVVPLWLGGHRFVLRDGLPPTLADPAADNVWPLRRCELLVGRHPESDIVVPARLEQVSRAHAVLEWTGATRVLVTDLSSGGTYLELPRHH